jgi:hypothetical protein
MSSMAARSCCLRVLSVDKYSFQMHREAACCRVSSAMKATVFVVGKDGIGARIGWRHKGIRRDRIVDSRVYGESEEPVGAMAEVGVHRSGVSFEFEGDFCN